MNQLSNSIIGLLLFLAGCTGVQMLDTAVPRQELMSVSSVPAFAPGGFSGHLKLKAMFRVLSDGTVAEVVLLNSSGSSEWDSAAVDSMKQWRFTTLLNNDDSLGHWIRYSLVVITEEPMVMVLGEIAIAGKQKADSLYALLASGVEFDSMAKQIGTGSPSAQCRFLGETGIARFPQSVRDELRKLRMNDFTRPLKRGDSYVIYMRFNHDGLRNLPQ
jgi:TonB family protein